jgi:hypothetical protein
VVHERNRKTLERGFQRLERELPSRAAAGVRKLREHHMRWVRIPVGLLLITGGIFSFLPALGIWMLPLGFLLIAVDVPVLRRPVGRSTLWATKKWVAVKGRAARR